jgi:hypothetical protein
MLIMETFGSDTAPPDVNSIRRVRQCDIFVGIYGHRYGTIEATTGKSITELELDEARRAHSAGVLSDMLLYIIDPRSAWLSDFLDVSIEANHGRARVIQKAHEHTYTIVKTKTELLFSIVRDVYRSIPKHFVSEQRALRPFNPPSPRRIRRPVGMEFLTSGDADYLIGREDAVNYAIDQLQNESMVLLLGESGVGKTSLIHAGLIPKAAALGWRPVYTRSLSMPCTDIVDQIESSVFEAGVRHRPLLQTVAELLSALEGTHLFLIIDQFEDVLNSTATDSLEDLLVGLSALRELSEPRLHIMISYRADLEGRLGTLWQRISGSPRGLARVYVEGLSVDTFWAQLRHVCEDLGISLKLTEAEATRVRDDMSLASTNWVRSGIYPPYIQMLIDFMFSSHDGGSFTFQLYQNANAIFGIVRAYLSRQLSLVDEAGDLRLLLIALVKSYGMKAQRTLQELAADTGFELAKCEAQLERLIDLRLARHFSGRYEISHDFLAKIIIEELVDSEEREFKRFRELLTSRAMAFSNTLSRLTVEEVLFLYKHRHRILYNDLEAILLIDTWVRSEVPGLFWIKDFDHGLVERQLATYETAKLEEPEQRFNVAQLKCMFGVPLGAEDYTAMTTVYKGAHYGAQMLRRLQSQVPASIALRGLRRRQGEIRDACAEIIKARVKNSEWEIIDVLFGSARKAYFRLFFELVLDTSIPSPNDNSRSIAEFRRLQYIGKAPRDALGSGLKELRSHRPRLPSVLFAEAVSAIRQSHSRRVLRSIAILSRRRARPMIVATETALTDDDFEGLLELYVKLNCAEINVEKTPSASAKAEDLAHVIRRLATVQRMGALRQMFQKIELKPSARDIMMAVLTNGDVDDVTAVLAHIGNAQRDLRYENHVELCLVAKQTLMKSSREMPDIYVSWVKSRNFWAYISKREKSSVSPANLLPLQNQGNRPLFIRLLAHAVVSLVRSSDDALLRALLRHSFTTISSAAAVRMSELIGDAALKEVSKDIDDAIIARRGGDLAAAIRRAEEALYMPY